MIPDFFKRKISAVRQKLYDWRGHPPVYNANKADERKFSQRALLIYLSSAYALDEKNPLFYTHQNFKQCRQIAAVLGELGFIVDVIDITDERFVPAREYDLVISHRVRHKYDPSLYGKNAIKAYLATGMHHVVHNRNVMRRHEELFKRRGVRLDARKLNDELMPYVDKVDAIIGFGNEYVMRSWKDGYDKFVYGFNNYGFKNTKFICDDKDFSRARKGFLFFASRTQVRKGLDLLLEFFPRHPDLQLYICSAYQEEKPFCELYHKELFETPNISARGFVPVNSDEFYDLCRKCAYVIMPSAEEGQAGSIVQCMHAGLIPVITRETGINVDDFGVMLENDSIGSIEKKVTDLARLAPETVQAMAVRTREICEKQYSEEAFLERWRNILTDLTGSKRGGK